MLVNRLFDLRIFCVSFPRFGTLEVKALADFSPFLARPFGDRWVFVVLVTVCWTFGFFPLVWEVFWDTGKEFLG